MTEVQENIQIHQFLDTLFKSNLSLTTADCQTRQNQEVEVKESLKLTKNVVLQNESETEQIYHKTFPDFVSEKYSNQIYSSEIELRTICKSIALTSDWILSKKDVYPWHHPKNVRYVDHYVKSVPAVGKKRIKPVKCKKIISNDVIRKCNVSNVGRETIDECLKKRKQKRARGIKKKQ